MNLEPPNSTGEVARFWYEVVSVAALRQGDILRGFPVFFAADAFDVPSEGLEAQVPLPGEFLRGDWVIVSPSCDIDNDKTKHVLLAACQPVSAATLKAQSQTDMDQKLQVVSQGLDPSKFLLPEHTADPRFPLSIVSNLAIGVMPVGTIRRFVGQNARLRLRHPFRERLGNWCGQWISRVGPENETLMPRFTSIYPKHVLTQNDG